MSFRFQPTGRKREPMASRGPKSNCCKFSTAMKERQRLTERQTGGEKERKKERKILKKKDRFCFIFELAFLALSLLKRLPVVVQCCDFQPGMPNGGGRVRRGLEVARTACYHRVQQTANYISEL